MELPGWASTFPSAQWASLARLPGRGRFSGRQHARTHVCTHTHTHTHAALSPQSPASLSRCTSHVPFLLSCFPFSLVSFPHGFVPVSPTPPPGPEPACPQNPVPREGRSQSSQRGGPGQVAPLPGASRGLGGEGRGEGPGGRVAGGARSVWRPGQVAPGSEVGAGGQWWRARRRVQGERSPVTPGDRDGSMAPVHTARGRSESKHLRPTLAGHAEGCPVIALCLGHSEGPGAAPSAVTQGPAALPRSTGRGWRHGDAPLPPSGSHVSPRPP